jgi:hypothetical protein
MLHILVAPLTLALGPPTSVAPVVAPFAALSQEAAHEPRALAADRPDVTESPITVDAGRIQVEASLADWTRTSGEDSVTALSANVKLGLSAATDLQLVVDSYSWLDSSGDTDDQQGFGDVQLRFKWNLWGNDGGVDAFALMPYLKIPTKTEVSNDEWEGGLILPYARSLTERVGLGLMAELDFVADDDGDLESELLYSAVLGFEVTSRMGAFIEYVGVIRDEGDPALANVGTTYEVHGDFVLDAGLRLGLNDDSEDLGVFVGFTVRY